MDAAGRESVRWYPRVTIEKYSPAQVRYARQHGEVPWSNRLGLSPRTVLSGELLRLLFREPEGGTVCDEGNGVTAGGLANMAQVLTGGGHPLAPGRVSFGVGSDGETEFDREQVSLSSALGEGPGLSWYRPMDLGYPRATGAVIEGQATFSESEACFEWHEWCWAAGTASPQPHHSLAGAYHGEQPAMMNRRASKVGYGLKEPGVAWVFRSQVTLLG